MFAKLSNTLTLLFILLISFKSLASWGPGNDMYDREQVQVVQRFAEIKSQPRIILKSPDQIGSFCDSLISDPRRVFYEMEKYEHYNLSSIEWKQVKKAEGTTKIYVPIGEFKWIEPGSDSLLYTDRILDCIGIVFEGPKLGLAHIPLDGHTHLKSMLKEILDPEAYKISLVSHYYSRNLDNIFLIIKEKFPTSPIHFDISRNYMWHDEDNSKIEGLKNHKWFYPYIKGRFMQAENVASRTICVDAKSCTLSRTLPQ